MARLSRVLVFCTLCVFGYIGIAGGADAPLPLLSTGQPADWWFVFKFNSSAFPGCGSGAPKNECPFGGKAQATKPFSQQFVYASSTNPTLKKGEGCSGATVNDPLGATFAQVYNGPFFFVIWNDQPYGHPKIAGCTSNGNCNAPWGHSKGMLAWNDAGEGLVLQVTTPSWPEAGSADAPRIGDGNTLGCIADNNVKLSQHFFALKLSKDDLLSVLDALENASVVTDMRQKQVARIGGPEDVQSAAGRLGSRSDSAAIKTYRLSIGVGLISKPSKLHVPPWQMVSSLLGGVALRTATFWGAPQIPSTTASSKVSCWDSTALKTKPGPVKIATSGEWDGKEFRLGSGGNHAKIGVSQSGSRHYVIFGDMNQQGVLTGDCKRSQNGRGGLFFVVEDEKLAKSVGELLDGDTAPTKLARPAQK